MAKSKRPLLRFLLLAVLLVGIPVATAPFIPLGALKPAVEKKLSGMLGRQVSVGSLRLSLLGGPYLYINQMVAKEDPAFGTDTFLQADQVRANFSILSYVLRRQIDIDSLKIQAPDLTFVKNSEGAWSWTTIGKADRASSPATALQNFQMFIGAMIQGVGEATSKKIEIQQASVRFLDRSVAQQPETIYRNVNLQAVVTRQSDSTNQVTGRLYAQSEEGDGAAFLRTEIPFTLTIDRSAPPDIALQGNLGPGRIASKNFSAEEFQSSVAMKEGIARLNEMEMNLYDGSLRGNLELNLATQQFKAEGEVQNLNLDEALASKLQLPGQITGHVNAQFKLSGLLRDFHETVLTTVGDGRITSSGLFIASVNISEQVAQSLKLNQIGDMNPGTTLGALEANFHIEQGVVSTSNLQMQHLDGLGDATSDRGWFQIEPTPTFNYAVDVLLSSDATAKVKTTSPIVGVAVSVLEVNNRVIVPVSVTGEVRSPQVAVDVKKFILGF